MKIIICGSISVAKEILKTKKELESLGYEVEIPEGVKKPEIARTKASISEKAVAFAHVLNKKLYCLYPVPNLSYTSEILAMQSIILNGNLKNISA